MFFKPNFDRILAKKLQNENKTISGIEFIKESDIEKAIVINVSNSIKDLSEIKVGFTIYYEPYTAINLPQENLILIKEIDVLGYEDKN